MIQSKKEIISELNAQSELFVQWYVNRNDRILEVGPEGAWTAGQHLLHMIKSTAPLAKGLGYPRILLRWRFGKAKAPGCTYDELMKRYTDMLSGKAVSPDEYVPRQVKWGEKELLLHRFRTEKRKMVNNISKWSEKGMDSTVLPHPLLGNITVREMMFFTIYHTSHHVRILEERY